jgi:hypothetical protein
MLQNDLKELLLAFNAHGVEYLVVGGYAVGIHAEPRANKDLDVFIRADAGNSERVYRALIGFGAPLRPISATIPQPCFRLVSRHFVSTSCSRSTAFHSTRLGRTE